MNAIDALRESRRREVSALMSRESTRAALAVHGSPLLVLDPDRVRRQYRRLRNALPFVRFHYAVKALSHDTVIAALAEAGCSFDVATGEELALVQRHGVSAHRIIHTHPIKKVSEIAEAIDAGVRTFVVDNQVIRLNKSVVEAWGDVDPADPESPVARIADFPVPPSYLCQDEDLVGLAQPPGAPCGPPRVGSRGGGHRIGQRHRLRGPAGRARADEQQRDRRRAGWGLRRQ